MNKFDWFVLPFSLGLTTLILILCIKYITWIKNLPENEFIKVLKGLFSFRSILALKDIFMESLLHRKVFKVNLLLGYMHCSLAFGWFLLILFGNWESRIFYGGHLSLPYIPIFFRFFNPNPHHFVSANMFSFLMDATLLIVLSGVLLAWLKRMYSRMFGMKKTTVLKFGDKLALTSLWLIFPLRFLAESFTSAIAGGGNFLTGTAGSFFAGILPVHFLAYPAWWAYSISLGCFFVALPFSRYMHIPTEILLIFMKRFGVSEKEFFTSYTEIEVNSCSRCGICINPCQLVSAADIRNVQSVYHIQSVRNKDISSEKSLNCLMCGRCDSICPVGIDISSIRMSGRIKQAVQKENCYSYVSNITAPKTDVIYFGGCISQIQPGIRKSMIELMNASKINYWFMDEFESICCGRPLLLSGKKVQAMELMAKNKFLIEKSKANTLVTSCPICYNMFQKEYNLNIRVMHHSEFLMEMAVEKKIEVKFQNISAVYHDPCELGRGSGIYEPPRNLLSRMVNLKPTGNERQNALCCGGSMANLKISSNEREMITVSVLNELIADEPDILVTGCPVCKKTFSGKSSIQVLDIAEIVSKSLIRNDNSMKPKKNKKLVNTGYQLIEN